jgi:hypothetical protein
MATVLLKSEEDDRDEILKATLFNMNVWIAEIRERYNKKPNYCDDLKRLFRGIVFPIFFGDDQYSTLRQIVRIPYEECRVFRTKSRTPYKLCIEFVDLDELEHEVEEEESIQFDQVSGHDFSQR